MKHFLLIGLLGSLALTSHGQSATLLPVPPKAISQLEDLKELTKSEALKGKAKSRAHAEVRPELNRYLVISADDFVRVASSTPTKEAYLKCLDAGLARLAPLTTEPQDRQQVAEYFQELMEIVGLASSEGRLNSFVTQTSSR